MDISTIPKKLKLILSKNKLNKLGKTTGFTKRERNITTFQLVTEMICSLGDKKTDYLSDILRCFNQLTAQNVRYKPFHNQLSKPALAELMKVVADKVFTYWINNVLEYKKGHFSKFKNVYIQDGSSFAVKNELSHIWPGRFTKISPACAGKLNSFLRNANRIIACMVLILKKPHCRSHSFGPASDQ